jgi:hypothetical protein
MDGEAQEVLRTVRVHIAVVFRAASLYRDLFIVDIPVAELAPGKAIEKKPPG